MFSHDYLLVCEITTVRTLAIPGYFHAEFFLTDHNPPFFSMAKLSLTVEKFSLRVYLDRTRQRQNNGVKHNALDSEHSHGSESEHSRRPRHITNLIQ